MSEFSQNENTKNISPKSFEIDKIIGAGQFSSVHRAYSFLTKEFVALKHIQISKMQDSKSKQDCLDEVQYLKNLSHPNIIQYRTSFFYGGDFFIVLELADAGNLSQMIEFYQQKNKLLPEKLIWKYYMQITSAVRFVHLKSILHRDIKPANIFLTVQGQIKLGDFGLSKYMNYPIEYSLVGTPYYMSPERIAEQKYSYPADIWSLGCLLYEMAALNSPFYEHGMNITGLRQKILSCSYPRLDNQAYSQHLIKLIDSCLVLDQSKRPSIHYISYVARKLRMYYKTNSVI